MAGVEIEDSDIGAAHKLPDAKKVKNRMVVKFLPRERERKFTRSERIWLKKTLVYSLAFAIGCGNKH